MCIKIGDMPDFDPETDGRIEFELFMHLVQST